MGYEHCAFPGHRADNTKQGKLICRKHLVHRTEIQGRRCFNGLFRLKRFLFLLHLAA
jgi:hypothetical protein